MPSLATMPRWLATWPTNPTSARAPSPGTPPPAKSNPSGAFIRAVASRPIAKSSRCLLFHRHELAARSMQLVIDGDGHALPVGTDRDARNRDHFPVAFVRFFDGIFVQPFHGDAAGTGITFVRRFRSIELRRIALSGWSGHRQAIAFHFVGEGEPVIRDTINLRDTPGAGNCMRSRRTLGHSRLFSLAGYRISVGCTAVGELEHQCVSVRRHPRF